MNTPTARFYRLGLRLAQARLMVKHAEKKGMSEDVDSARVALARLSLAVDECYLKLAGSVSQVCNDIIQSVRERLTTSSFGLPPTVTGGVQAIASLQPICRDQIPTPNGPSSVLAAWFELGLTLAEGEYNPGTLRPTPAGEEDSSIAACSAPTVPSWRWPRELDELLDAVQTPLADLFPEDASQKAVWEFANSLPCIPQSPTWVVLELGWRNLSAPQPSAPSERPQQNRDRQLLAWYEKVGTDTCGSATNVRERWNAENSDKPIKSNTVVYKALARARVDRDGKSCTTESP